MAILDRGDLVGRVDMTADRRTGVLNVERMYHHKRSDLGSIQRLARALMDLATFCGCDDVRIINSDDARTKRQLRHTIASDG